MSECVFEVLGEPVAKARPRRAPKGTHMYTPDHSAAWENRVAETASRQGVTWPGDVALRLEVYFVMSRPSSAPKRREYPIKRPDVSNLLKAIEDACVRAGLFRDEQVVDLVGYKRYGELAMARILVMERDDGCFPRNR